MTDVSWPLPDPPTIAEFLLARIAEDEVVAERVHEVYDCNLADPEGEWCTCGHPARVLAECEAKRRIVETYEFQRSLSFAAATPDQVPHWRGVIEGLRQAVVDLASIYAEHPDYREEWRA